MKKILIAILLLSCFGLYSQEKGHYLSLGGRIGGTSFEYDGMGGMNSKCGLGFGGDLRYSFYFTKNFGIGSGFSVSYYTTPVELNNYETVFKNRLDDDMIYRDFDKRVKITNWEETQKTLFAEIPVLFLAQHKFGKLEQFGIYGHLGAKFQLPLNSKYEITSGQVENRGEYYDLGNFVLFNMPNHGYGVDGKFPSGDLNLKFGVSATAGVGFLFGLSRVCDLYLGGFIDYGILDIKDKSEGNFVYLDDQDNTNNENSYRSFLHSDNVDKVRPIFIGGEVGIRYKFGKSSKETFTEQKERQDTELELTKQADSLAKIEEKQRLDDFRAESAGQNKEMNNTLKRMEDLLGELVQGIKDAKVERVKDQNNEEAIKIEWQANILFDVNKSELKSTAKESLIGLVQILQENPSTIIDIYGHTDNTGTLTLNQKLSSDRAEAVADYLYTLGVSETQIRKIVGKNYSMPIADNETVEGRAKNRRVEVYLYNRK